MTACEGTGELNELEAVRNSLRAARIELELAKAREQKLMSELNLYGGALSDRSPQHGSPGRFVLLLAIGALAAWQVYLTLKLQVLLY